MWLSPSGILHIKRNSDLFGENVAEWTLHWICLLKNDKFFSHIVLSKEVKHSALKSNLIPKSIVRKTSNLYEIGFSSSIKNLENFKICHALNIPLRFQYPHRRVEFPKVLLLIESESYIGFNGLKLVLIFWKSKVCWLVKIRPWLETSRE